MKRNILLLAIAMLAAVFAHAQSYLNIPTLASHLPPPPNAYELTKYAGVPVNLASGAATVSIPLGEVRHGKLSLPVSISYNSGNGVKVDQMPSHAGMSWVLNAGGVISRSVAGKPDEASSTIGLIPDLSQQTNAIYDLLHGGSDNISDIDLEDDVFSFNFNGFSGEFILQNDLAKTPLLLKASPLKIQTNFSSTAYTFIITDPTGTKYYFGGSTATEKSKTETYGGVNCGRGYDQYVPTAWYLVKVVSYTGETINLTYNSYTMSYMASASETILRTPPSTLAIRYTEFNQNGQLMIFDPDNPSFTWEFCDQKSEYRLCPTRISVQGVKLATIESASGHASFIHQKYPETPDGDLTGYDIISGIYFYKKNAAGVSESLGSYSFGYLYSSNTTHQFPAITNSVLTTRPFLASLFSTTGNNHTFKYYDMNMLPGRLSFAQDHWGYFNNRANTYFTPRSSEGTTAVLFPSNMADREPNADYAKYGLLRAISYPTGGVDSLVYEPNTVYEPRLVSPTTYTFQVQGTGTNTTQTSNYYFTAKDTRLVRMDMENIYGTGLVDSIHQKANFRIFNSLGTQIYHRTLNVGQALVMDVALPTDSYRLEIQASGTPAIARVYITYQPNSYTTANWQTGGMRLAKNITYPITGETMVKQYIYAALATQWKSSGVLRTPPEGNNYYASTPVYMQDDINLCPYITGSSASNIPLNYPSGGHIYYDEVIEVMGNNWENGGTVRKFYNFGGYYPLQTFGNKIPAPIMAYGPEAGQEIYAQTFKTTGGSYGSYTTLPVTETFTHYKEDERTNKVRTSYSVRRKFTLSTGFSPRQAHEFQAFDIAKYDVVRKWIYPDTITTINYATDGSVAQTTKQIVAYADTTHFQPTEVSTINSDNLVTKVLSKYPKQLAGTAVYDTLVNRNRVALEIEKKRYVNGSLVESIYTPYNNFGGGKIEPQKLQYQQGTGTTYDQAEMLAYNGRGNIRTQRQPDGIKISYQYGYQGNHIVAECKNADSTEFYHQNFEESTAFTLNNAHTGLRFYTGDYAVTFDITPSVRSFVISYWYKDGIWKYKEKPYTGPTTLIDGTGIDDINIFPADAQMKTFTYYRTGSPLSTIDEKGLTTFYDYDGNHRLAQIRNNDGEVTEAFRYNLTGPKSVHLNELRWQTFTKSCSPGQTGTNVTYTVPAGKYISTVSLADANNAALADIAANGQNFANAQGSCVSGNITLSYNNFTMGSDIAELKIRNSSGTLLYTFDTAALLSNVTIAQGTYTFEFTFTGPDWYSCYVTSGSTWYIDYNPSLSTYVINNINLSTTTGTIYLDFVS